MKRKKLFARFLKDTFLADEQSFPVRRINRMVRKLQKEEAPELKTTPQEALQSFLSSQKADFPVEAGNGRKRKVFLKTAVGITSCAAGLVLTMGGVWLKGRIGGDKNFEMKEEAISLSEEDIDFIPEGSWENAGQESVRPGTLEEADELSESELQLLLKGMERQQIHAAWGSPQEIFEEAGQEVYNLPSGDRVLILCYETAGGEETISEIMIQDIR